MPPASAQPRRAAMSSLAVAAGILLSRFAGLVRQRIFARYLGLSPAADAFTAALRIPNFLQNLFGEGILSGSFIPVYAKLLAQGDEATAGRVASITVSLLTLAVGATTLIGMLCAPLIVALLAPGFQGEVRALTTTLVRIMFPGVGLLALSAWCLGILNSHRRFFISYVAPVLWNAAIVATLLCFGRTLAGSATGQFELAIWVGWGTVAGALLQLALLLPTSVSLLRHGRSRLRPELSLALPPVRTVLRNFLPMLLSRGVLQVSAFIDQALATLIGSGANAAMAYAQMIYLVPVSLFGMSVSAAELPEMSGASGTPEEVAAQLRQRLTSGLGRIAFFVVPSVAAFLMLGDLIVALLFQTGTFQHDDTVFVWMILAGSALGLLASTQSRLFSSACYALHDARTPLRYALVRVALTTLLGAAATLAARLGWWSPQLGTAGLTASAGLAGWFEFVLLARALRQKIGPFSVGGRDLVKLWAAALFAVAAGSALRFAPLPHPLVRGLVILGSYGAVYLLATLGLAVPEARATATRLFLRRRK